MDGWAGRISGEPGYGNVPQVDGEGELVSKAGILQIAWPRLLDKSEQGLPDLLLATATHPTLHGSPSDYRSAEMIAHAWNADIGNNVEYFRQNTAHGMHVSRRCNSRTPPMNWIQTRLAEIESLDFSGKGESFVESKFLTPLLEYLGYETQRDYEVIRHGDDGSSFKLNYPPVETGAKRVKHYNPDFIPTIRKKMFWVIEAKSPTDVPHPFDVKYIVQGLQYCIHPEIQAQYLLVSNDLVSCLFDAHGAVFL